MQKVHMIRKLPICALFATSLSKMNHLSSCICLEIISLCEVAEVVILRFSIILYLDLIRLIFFLNCGFT